MIPKILLIAASMILILSCSDRGPEFTEWMPRKAFLEYLAERQDKGDTGKNFWDSGHWVDAVECEWKDGYQNYRVAIGTPPEGMGNSWYWYFDMNQEFFEKRLTDYSIKGFQMVWVNKSINPNGKEIFAAVWHKSE